MWNLFQKNSVQNVEPVIPQKEHWYFCLLRCSDGSLYADIASDPKALVVDFNEGRKKAAYTTRRLPVFLALTEEYMHKEDAKSRLFAVQTMPRARKEDLVTAGGVLETV